MLKEKLMEPPISEQARPIVFALRTDGKMRFCVKYGNLSAMTIRATY